MRTRTRLTTPPGERPALDDDGARADEAYVPGLALPEEPHIPGRRRRLWVTLAVVAVLAVIAYVSFRVATAGQSFDPALEPEVDGGATEPVAPEGGLPGEG